MANFINSPAPKWFRTFNRVYENSETFIITLLMVSGKSADAPLLLYIKLISTFVRTNLALILTGGEEYAPAGATEALVNVTGQSPSEAIKENAPLQAEKNAKDQPKS